MGCEQARSLDVIDKHPEAKKHRMRSINNRKNVNPDEITEAIEIISSKLNEEQIIFAVTKLSDHQLFGTLNKR